MYLLNKVDYLHLPFMFFKSLMIVILLYMYQDSGKGLPT